MTSTSAVCERRKRMLNAGSVAEIVPLWSAIAVTGTDPEASALTVAVVAVAVAAPRWMLTRPTGDEPLLSASAITASQPWQRICSRAIEVVFLLHHAGSGNGKETETEIVSETATVSETVSVSASVIVVERETLIDPLAVAVMTIPTTTASGEFARRIVRGSIAAARSVEVRMMSCPTGMRDLQEPDDAVRMKMIRDDAIHATPSASVGRRAQNAPLYVRLLARRRLSPNLHLEISDRGARKVRLRRKIDGVAIFRDRETTSTS